MSQPFDKGSMIVLVLLLVFGGIFAWDTMKDIRNDDEIVAETDARTCYLRDQVVALEARVKALEEKSGGPAAR